VAVVTVVASAPTRSLRPPPSPSPLLVSSTSNHR
jgi:hypothetical protein